MSLISKLKTKLKLISQLDQHLDALKINQGRMLSQQSSCLDSKNINEYEFSVFSQWGEDGIIQYLIRNIEIKNRTFIEFGVEDFRESNCRFLLMKDNWSGFIIDGSDSNVKRITEAYYYWRYDLTASRHFLTVDNINQTLASSGFDSDLGRLSIDIDGNDYHILKAISTYNPRILICEYNATFGPTRHVTIPYAPDFNRFAAHYSGLYFGASLQALAHIARSKGYELVAVNSSGCNAFFIRHDLINEHTPPIDSNSAFVPAMFKESRNQNGDLSYLRHNQRLDILKGLPVMNVVDGKIEIL